MRSKKLNGYTYIDHTLTAGSELNNDAFVLIDTLKNSYRDISRQEINRMTGCGTAELKSIWGEYPNPRLISVVALAKSCGYKLVLVKE